MREMMKRYEAETDEVATWTWHNKEFVTDDVLDWAWEKIQKLQAENSQLKDQLRWRPVSEKPEKADMYFVECNQYTGWGSTIMTTAWFDGEEFPWYDVVKWLPIPPTLEETP